MNARLRLLFLVLVSLIGGYSLGLASVEPYQVVINDNPSKIKVLRDKDELLVPLTLPASSQPQEWTVSLQRDDKTHKVEVKLVCVKKKLRGDTDCYWCSTTGNCALDYPAGSGLTFAGVGESYCNGTGKCYHCGGTGKL